MRVELEITLRCNRKCPECNRYCERWPWMLMEDSVMSLEQIDKFCSQVEANGKRLTQVSLIGGEPLLHPQYAEIAKMLHERLRLKRLVREIRLCTNGDALSTTHPRDLENVRIKVDWSKPHHRSSVTAPIDTGQALRACHVPSHCGICLNVWGYWPCGAGGAIARLFGLPQYQRMELPRCVEEFGDLKPLCDLCQLSARDRIPEGVEPSSSYRLAIEAYKANPVNPTLKRF